MRVSDAAGCAVCMGQHLEGLPVRACCALWWGQWCIWHLGVSRFTDVAVSSSVTVLVVADRRAVHA